MAGLPDEVEALAFDVFGTCVDWWTGITRQVAEITTARGIDVDAEALTGAGRPPTRRPTWPSAT